jgi:hypothetical protein
MRASATQTPRSATPDRQLALLCNPLLCNSLCSARISACGYGHAAWLASLTCLGVRCRKDSTSTIRIVSGVCNALLVLQVVCWAFLMFLGSLRRLVEWLLRSLGASCGSCYVTTIRQRYQVSANAVPLGSGPAWSASDGGCGRCGRGPSAQGICAGQGHYPTATSSGAGTACGSPGGQAGSFTRAAAIA